MSFGFSIGDIILLTQLALGVVNGAREACGAHDELTREVTSLHIVLRALEREAAKPNSILNSEDDDRKNELQQLVEHCEKQLKVLEKILDKYNGLSEDQRRVTKFYKKVKFGSGEMVELSKLRLELATHTNVITMFLNLLSVGSLGKLEAHMNSNEEGMKGLRQSVNWITGSLQAQGGHGEGSILTAYTSDDRSFWKDLRRELVKEGYSSRVLRKHKTTIQEYVKELGNQGALDELPESLDSTSVTEVEAVSLGEASSPTPAENGEDNISIVVKPQIPGSLDVSSSVGAKEAIQVPNEAQPPDIDRPSTRRSSEDDRELETLKYRCPLPQERRTDTESSSAEETDHRLQQPELLVQAKDWSHLFEIPYAVLSDVPCARFPDVTPANVRMFEHERAKFYIQEARSGRFLEPQAKYKSTLRATIEAKLLGFPRKWNVSRWDGKSTGIVMMGNVFDHYSFGQWVFDWNHHIDGGHSRLTRRWGQIWIILCKLGCVDCWKTVGSPMVESISRECRKWARKADPLLVHFGKALEFSANRKLHRRPQGIVSGIENFTPHLTEKLQEKWFPKALEWSTGFQANWPELATSKIETYLTVGSLDHSIDDDQDQKEEIHSH